MSGITTTASWGISYNANGDRVSQTNTKPTTPVTDTMGYDQSDRLASFANSTASTSYTYAYNGDGLRMSKTTITNSTGAKSTAYETWDIADGLPRLLAPNNATLYYVYGPGGLPLEQIAVSGSTNTVNDFWHDALGSTRLLSTGAGTTSTTTLGSISLSYSYTLEGDKASQSGSATTNLLFTGAYKDGESNVYYLINRYYDATTTHSFLTVDPLVGMTGQPYGYAGQNPINLG